MNQQKSEIVRELISKPTTKKILVLFVVPKLYIKNKNIKDELCKKYIIHLLFFLHRNKRIV